MMFYNFIEFSVRRCTKRYGFKEVGEDEDWNLYWTDYSVALERVMDMKKYQVRIGGSLCLSYFSISNQYLL